MSVTKFLVMEPTIGSSTNLPEQGSRAVTNTISILEVLGLNTSQE
jgi:hypothetical protein